jgi:hypothetical protein
MGKLKSSGNKAKTPTERPKASETIFKSNFDEAEITETKKKHSQINKVQSKTIKKAKNEKSAVLKVINLTFKNVEN